MINVDKILSSLPRAFLLCDKTELKFNDKINTKKLK